MDICHRSNQIWFDLMIESFIMNIHFASMENSMKRTIMAIAAATFISTSAFADPQYDHYHGDWRGDPYIVAGDGDMFADPNSDFGGPSFFDAKTPWHHFDKGFVKQLERAEKKGYVDKRDFFSTKRVEIERTPDRRRAVISKE